MKTHRFLPLLALLPSLAHAQDNYDDVLKRALAQHPKIVAAKAAIEAERAGKGELLSPFRPMASANGYFAGGDGSMIFPSTVDPVNYAILPRNAVAMGNLTLMWKVWTGGRESAARDLGNSRIEAAEHMLGVVEQDVMLGLRLAFVEYVFQVGAENAARSAAEAALETERNAVVMEQAGKVPKAYVLRASAAARKLEQEVAIATAGVASAKAALDEAAGGPVGVGEKSMPKGREAPNDLAAALLLGEQRQELKFFVAMAEANGIEASYVRRSLRPEVSLMAMGMTMGASSGISETNAKFGLVFSVPLSDGGMRSSRAKMLEAKAKEFMAQAEDMRLTVRREIQSAWAEWTAVEKVIESAKAGLVAAEESYDVERLRFESGKSIMAELLDAQAALAQARIDVLNAERFSDTSWAKLVRAIGASYAGR